METDDTKVLPMKNTVYFHIYIFHMIEGTTLYSGKLVGNSYFHKVQTPGNFNLHQTNYFPGDFKL